MKVYSVSEEHPLYTLYEHVEIEECGDEFLSDDEWRDLDRDSRFNVWGSGGKHSEGIYNNKAISDLIGEIGDLFENRKKGRKTVAYVMDIDEDRVKEKVREKLKEVGLKYVGGRIQKHNPKKKVRKDYIRKEIVFTVERYLQSRIGGDDVEINITRVGSIANQERVVRFAHTTLGLSFEDIRRMRMSRTNQYGYVRDVTDEQKDTIGKEWWESCLPEENRSHYGIGWYDEPEETVDI